MHDEDAAFLRGLVEAAPAAASATLASDDALRTAIVAQLRDAEADWPCALGRETFARHVAARLPDADVIPAIAIADLRLACACVHDVHGAQTRLRERHMGDIRRGIGRQPDAATVDELVADVLRHVLVAEKGGAMRLGDYTGRGSLGRWLSVCARRIALDRARANKSHGESLDDDGLAAAYGDPELAAMKQSTRDAFRAAVEEAAGELQARDRNMLRYVFVHDLALDELAGIYRVSRSTVSRQLSAVREKLVERVRERMCERLGVSGDDLERELAQMRSAIAVTLSRILKSPR